MDKIRNVEEKTFSKQIKTPLPRPRPDFREVGIPENFQYFLFFSLFGGLGGGGSTTINLTPFFVLQNIFVVETLWRLVVNRKKLRLDLRYYWKLFYKYKFYFGGMLN